MAASRLLLFVTLLTTFHCPGFAADSVDLTASYQQTAHRLIDAALADDAGYEKLSYLCDRIGNRLSGSPALKQAIAWAADQMKKDGLMNVATLPVKVPHWVRGQEGAVLLAPVNRELHLLGLGMSVGTTAEGLTADAVVVSSFDELTKLGRSVAGKIVVFNAAYQGYGPTVQYRVQGASRAAALGAVAALVRSITPLALQIPHTGTLQYAPDLPQIPAGAITIEDAMMLERLRAAGSPIRIHLQMSDHMEPDSDAANVIGEIPGAESPEEVVVMGGHIDSWDVGQGAQDDGSGIVASLEAADLIRKLDLRPKRTIRVVFWVNEENGTRGGEAYRKWAKDRLKDHVAAIEMDEGAETPLGFGYSPSGASHGPASRLVRETSPQTSSDQEHSKVLCQQIAKLLEYRINAGHLFPAGGGTDIGPIMADGVPGLSPQTTAAHYFDWHHTTADTVDKVNPEDFKKDTALMAVLAYVLADMPERLTGSVTSK